jgi:hypothetical protein
MMTLEIAEVFILSAKSAADLQAEITEETQRFLHSLKLCAFNVDDSSAFVRVELANVDD